jgi:hypothetical protein
MKALPTVEAPTVQRWMSDGLRHLALNVYGIGNKLQVLDGKGLRLIDHEPRRVLSGTIGLIHPVAAFGVLTELVESLDSPSPWTLSLGEGTSTHSL